LSWELAGGVAVVTGAASGIGRALAVRLARERMSLAVCDVNALELDRTAALTREAASDAALGAAGAGTSVTTHIVDVGDARRVRDFADEALAAHGRVTLLVNNAGVALHGRFEELSLDDIDWLMRINFWGVVNGTKMFLPILRRERRAHIANLSSVFGIIAPAGQTAYSASKFAIRGFTEALRHELAGTGVGVSCVHPGGIRTRIAADGRVASGASGSAESYSAEFDRLARHSAEFAAGKIVDGVKRNKARILIGAEAYALDAIQRLMPAHYWKLMQLSGMGRNKSV
jgi:NAD(P)-dependent dehydrogenase (short-subunit alcohol dehydrogenase family)